MTERRTFPFGGVPVYNPQSLSKAEALAQFEVRQAAYQSLMEMLREECPSHVLIIGTRGMGKTTLLQRVRYGVEDDAELNGRYLALFFPEEQYNVNRLHHFLLNTIDALADAVERLKNERLLAHVEAYTNYIGQRTAEEVEEQVPQFLAEVSRQMNKNLLLLVDNADRLFETIDAQQQWRLREMLSSRKDLTFFGATTKASDGIYGPDRAFYEFFKIHRLAPLTLEEVRDLMLGLSESVEEDESEKGTAKRRVAAWLSSDTARLRTLVQLTGGNPRTTVLLFHLVLDGLTGGAREYLEQLLDQVTPNYKGRVDELPPQAQQVLDAVSLRWDPVTASEVAADTGLETNIVSTQLTRLLRQGLLERVDPGESKKALYQVAERFFNIWYLMRASRRVRAKLRWFIEFLRVFYDSSELELIAWQRIGRNQESWRAHPEEIETDFAYVLASGAGPARFENYLQDKCADIEEMWRPYITLLRNSAEHGVPFTEPPEQTAESEVALRRAIERNPTSASDWVNLGAYLMEVPERTAEAEAAFRTAIELDPNSVRAWGLVGTLLMGVPERSAEAEAAFRKAVELDSMHAWAWMGLGYIIRRKRERATEAEAAFRKAVELDPKLSLAWMSLGRVLWLIPERSADAEAAFRRAVELDPNSAKAWGLVGAHLMVVPERSAEAEAAFRKAAELDPKLSLAWTSLGQLLRWMPERRAEAEAAFRKAVELDPDSARVWEDLGAFLSMVPERDPEAEAVFRKAVELDPKFTKAWTGLADFLADIPERAAEAEAGYRKAIELDPNSARVWEDLGAYLTTVPEHGAEAEAAFRKAVELDPKFIKAWTSLGDFLAEIPERAEEAESAYRIAVELDPKKASSWSSLGFFLACRAGKPRDAEIAFRKSVQLDPDSSIRNRNLGVLLYCELGEPLEGLTYIDRAHQLAMNDPISAVILAASAKDSTDQLELLGIFLDAAREADFWNELLHNSRNYTPFGKILVEICELIKRLDSNNRFVNLYRAVALAQVRDFPRASVALEDAMTGDPIELLSIGRRALETFFAAAVRCGRVRDCLELIDKKNNWKDAWRPIFEALVAVENGSDEHLKHVAVEIREPAQQIYGSIALQR
jgi:Flp pilus assembly protein TadD